MLVRARIIDMPRSQSHVYFLFAMHQSSIRWRVHTALDMGNNRWLLIAPVHWVLPKIMQPPANEITIIPDGVVEVSEPNMESLGTEAHHTEDEAAKPSKSVHSGVHYQRIAKHREEAPCKHVGNTQCSQQLRNDWDYNLPEDPEPPQTREAVFSNPLELDPPAFVDQWCHLIQHNLFQWIKKKMRS